MSERQKGITPPRDFWPALVTPFEVRETSVTPLEGNLLRMLSRDDFLDDVVTTEETGKETYPFAMLIGYLRGIAGVSGFACFLDDKVSIENPFDASDLGTERDSARGMAIKFRVILKSLNNIKFLYDEEMKNASRADEIRKFYHAKARSLIMKLISEADHALMASIKSDMWHHIEKSPQIIPVRRRPGTLP